MSLNNIELAELLTIVRKQGAYPQVHSGAVKPGDIFVILAASVAGEKGAVDFLPQALEAGARFLVCQEQDLAKVKTQLAVRTDQQEIRVCVITDTRMALGQLAGAFYGTEHLALRLVAITGTNGKTTNTYLLEELFSKAGYKVGVLGTVNYRWPGICRPAPLTTPGCLELHGLLAEMQEAGVEIVFMEVSSHALEQNRIAGLAFSAALFTNITQDHMDYHGNMENYYQSKARLFFEPPLGFASSGMGRAINIDDCYGERLLNSCAGQKGIFVAYGLQAKQPEVKNVYYEILAGKVLFFTPQGLHMEQHYAGQKWELRSPLVGRFNAMNLLGVQAISLTLGLKPKDFKALENIAGVPGRLERIQNRHGRNVFVDYAHTPDALENAQLALREAGFKRIVTLFGCGGNRDRSKRPLMGEAVAKYSDIAILTSDNPRHESPEKIMQDVLPGLAACPEYYVIADRREATRKAVQLIGAEDALLVAGKGHEDYQIIGAEKIPYSDQAVLQYLLDQAGSEG